MSSTESGSDASGTPQAAPPPPQGATPAPAYPAAPPGYAAPPPGYGAPGQAKRPAIVLVALLLSWIFLVGLILALIARAKVKRGNTAGKGMATAALIISLVFTGGEVAAIAVGLSTTNLHNAGQLATQVQSYYNDHTGALNGATASSVTCQAQSAGSNNYTCDITDSKGNNWTVNVSVNNNFQGTVYTNTLQQQ
jgi:hypothetical protein